MEQIPRGIKHQTQYRISYRLTSVSYKKAVEKLGLYGLAGNRTRQQMKPIRCSFDKLLDTTKQLVDVGLGM